MRPLFRQVDERVHHLQALDMLVDRRLGAHHLQHRRQVLRTCSSLTAASCCDRGRTDDRLADRLAAGVQPSNQDGPARLDARASAASSNDLPCREASQHARGL